MIDFKQKKLFLLDMDGTIYLGDTLFDGTLDFLNRVRERGGKYLFVTNNSSRSVSAYVDRLEGMGIPAAADDFLTSVDALVWYLRGKYDDALIYAFGTRTFREQLSEAGFRVTDKLEDGVSLLVCGFDTELTFQKLEDACILLGRGVDFVATNPDWVCPTSYGSVPDCGSVCEMLFRATGRRPKFIGKPEPEMALLSMERYGYSREETVLIGDRIYTDIACGVHAGIDTAFVLSGEGVPADIEKFHIQPSETYQNIREIFDRMG
ncbi:HAD-IIA family hydrolase [Pseudoflavonifractor phocaeensis]|uniref:HAD-IIA family hydrolase n=1 Tax=Pseudoflavonifractor phocaeensis TaxID=1870988 RepID=UPI001F42F50B|nr:HAD-IIA family hydrolase [Pseudoflavonifractor phocaeensis]MCF2661359.1 HAD-IIA family hydrolase [Pseudoflavonifractor phocaeensis]